MTQEDTQEMKRVQLTFSNGQKLAIDVPADELKSFSGVFVSTDGGEFQGGGIEGSEVEGLEKWLANFKRKEFHRDGETVYCTNQIVSVAMVTGAPKVERSTRRTGRFYNGMPPEQS